MPCLCFLELCWILSGGDAKLPAGVQGMGKRFGFGNLEGAQPQADDLPTVVHPPSVTQRQSAH